MSLLRRLEEQKQMEDNPEINEHDKPATNSTVKSDPYQYLKTKIHKRIVAEMSLEDSKALVEKKADIKHTRFINKAD